MAGWTAVGWAVLMDAQSVDLMAAGWAVSLVGNSDDWKAESWVVMRA